MHGRGEGYRVSFSVNNDDEDGDGATQPSVPTGHHHHPTKKNHPPGRTEATGNGDAQRPGEVKSITSNRRRHLLATPCTGCSCTSLCSSSSDFYCTPYVKPS